MQCVTYTHKSHKGKLILTILLYNDVRDLKGTWPVAIKCNDYSLRV